MEDPGALNLLLCLCPVSRIRKEEGFLSGKNKNTLTAGKTAKITNIFKTTEEDPVESRGIDDLPNRLLPHLMKWNFHFLFFLSRMLAHHPSRRSIFSSVERGLG